MITFSNSSVMEISKQREFLFLSEINFTTRLWESQVRAWDLTQTAWFKAWPQSHHLLDGIASWMSEHFLRMETLTVLFLRAL